MQSTHIAKRREIWVEYLERADEVTATETQNNFKTNRFKQIL